jgi:bifunctional aspartate aminotransferase and glutamate/aspartate-prephenate aminotransferase
MNEMVVGNGAKQRVYQGILATCGVGDKVLIPAPYWPSYPEMVKLVRAQPIVVETTADNGYLLTADALRNTLKTYPEIKLMILCKPSNPTGGVYHLEQLQALADVLQQEFPHVLVLADEMSWRMKCTNVWYMREIVPPLRRSCQIGRSLSMDLAKPTP